MTRNLKYFSGLTLIFSIIFFNYLYAALLNESYNNIGIYAIHTALDNNAQGVSAKMAEILQLTNTQILLPKKGKIIVCCYNKEKEI